MYKKQDWKRAIPLTMKENSSTKKEIIRSFQTAEFALYDEKTPFMAFEEERAIFNGIRNGDTEAIYRLCSELKDIDAFTAGKMSSEPLKQAQFEVVIGISLAARYAIAGGLPDTEGFHLSDAYVQQLTDSLTVKETFGVFLAAIRDFVTSVKMVKSKGSFSLPTTRAVKYIHSHLHEKITLADLAGYCKVTPQYISSVFHRDTGYTVSEYIRRKKLSVAAQMLEQSDYSIQSISLMLEFPSQSAFTAQFRECYGITPNRYRKEALNQLLIKT